MRVGLGFLSSSAALLTADLFRSSHLPLKRLLLPSISPNRIPARPPPPSRQPLAFAFFSAMASTHKPEDARVPPALHLTTPPVSKFKIGLCQLAVTAYKERNIVHARKAIEEAAGKGAKLVLLPEIWNCPTLMIAFQYMLRILKLVVMQIPHFQCCLMLLAVCRLQLLVDLYRNAQIHLFDIDIPGKITFKESKTLTAGQHPTIVDTDVGRIGLGICYDIRFQELAMLYAARGAHLLCYPGAFNMTTGPLHWELLQRASYLWQLVPLPEMVVLVTLLGVIPHSLDLEVET